MLNLKLVAATGLSALFALSVFAKDKPPNVSQDIVLDMSTATHVRTSVSIKEHPLSVAIGGQSEESFSTGSITVGGITMSETIRTRIDPIPKPAGHILCPGTEVAVLPFQQKIVWELGEDAIFLSTVSLADSADPLNDAASVGCAGPAPVTILQLEVTGGTGQFVCAEGGFTGGGFAKTDFLDYSHGSFQAVGTVTIRAPSNPCPL